MKSRNLNLRVSPAEWDELQRRADVECGGDKSAYIRKKALRGFKASEEGGKARARDGDTPAASRPPETSGPEPMLAPEYGCPVPGCDFKAKSPNARCGVHGRMVVP